MNNTFVILIAAREKQKEGKTTVLKNFLVLTGSSFVAFIGGKAQPPFFF